MQSVLTRFLCIPGLLAALTANAADWPQFRGPNNDGTSPEKGINKDWKAKPPKELWKVTLGDKGFAGPCVAAGMLFIIDHQGSDDIVRALDIVNGQEKWNFKYADSPVDGFGAARSTPLFDAGKLYTISRQGMLHCLDAAKGTKLWARNIKADFKGNPGGWAYAASPIADGDKLLVCPGGKDAGMAALDKNTGKDIWSGGGSDKAGYATPVIATISGKRQYLLFSGLALLGVDPENGKVLWSFPWKTNYDVNAAAPIPFEDSIFISSNYGKGCALVKDGKAVWENKSIQEHFSSGVLSDGFVYSTSDPGALVCLDPKTGKSVWRQQGFEKGGLAAVDGTLIVLDGANGDVAMVKLQRTGYQELGRIKPLGGNQCWTAPIVADGKLFVRNKSALVCLDLK